jgi:putative membrane protein
MTRPRLSPGSALLAAALLLSTEPASAHGADPDPGHGISDNPRVWIGLALFALLYAIGVARLWRHAGRAAGISRRQLWAFAAGMLALIVALLSPLAGRAEELASAHMIQHMLIMLVAAPLVVLGRPLLAAIWAAPVSARRQITAALQRARSWRSPWYYLAQPAAACVLFAATLWLWHLPRFYQAALDDEIVHDFQHLGFFATSGLFWAVLFDPMLRLRLNRGLAVLYLFATSLHATLLGVLMALAPSVWYPSYAAGSAHSRLSPLEDQALAGFLMWMPGCMVYSIAAAVLFGLWLRDPRPRA